MTKKKINLKILVIFLINLFIITILIKSVFHSFLQDDILQIQNSQTVIGKIIDIVDIDSIVFKPLLGKHYDYFCEGTIIVEYEVNGIMYYQSKRVTTYGSGVKEFNYSGSKYYIGKNMKVIYDSKLPENSIINEFEIYEIVFNIIIGIIILFILSKFYKQKT